MKWITISILPGNLDSWHSVWMPLDRTPHSNTVADQVHPLMAMVLPDGQSKDLPPMPSCQTRGSVTMLWQVRAKSKPGSGLHGLDLFIDISVMLDRIGFWEFGGQADTLSSLSSYLAPFLSSFFWCGRELCRAGGPVQLWVSSACQVSSTWMPVSKDSVSGFNVVVDQFINPYFSLLQTLLSTNP